MDASSDLNLRWNEHSHTFVHLLNHFRLQKLYCDARLACAGGSVFPVHKVVLSACSEFFASIFESANWHNAVVVLQDVGRDELETLLTYVYRGEVRIPRNALPSFLKVAESLQVKGLAPPPLAPIPQSSQDPWCVPDPQETPPDPLTHVSPHYIHTDPPPYPQHPDIGHPVSPVTPNLCMRRNSATWGEEEKSSAPPASHHVVSPVRRGSLGEREDHTHPGRRSTPPRSYATQDHIGGTFQNLVASEEQKIKEEPAEASHDLYDSDRLTICEKEEEEEEEEEEDVEDDEIKEGEKEEEEREKKRRWSDGGTEREGKVESMDCGVDDGGEGRGRDGGGGGGGGGVEMVFVDDKEARHSPPNPITTITTHNLNSLDALNPTPPPHAPQISPSSASPTAAATPSQLRRELLKPLQYRLPALQHPVPLPQQSIPHPVIAIRDHDKILRDPPPLVKLPQSPPVPPLHHPSLTHKQHPQQQHPQEQQHSPSSSHFHLQPRHSDVNDSTTTKKSNSRDTLSSSTQRHYQHHQHHHHHHLLVSTQPTYRPRVTYQTQTSQYTPLPGFYGASLGDAEGPLNLSQSPESAYEAKKNRDPFLGKILTNRKRRLRGPKSWEYLVRLLKDPTTNPQLIRWENEALGVFRLVQPAVIAQRWGRRTGKHASECLTYENFARGLRYHYATGALEPVSERSFVYKFGPKALGVLRDCEVSVISQN